MDQEVCKELLQMFDKVFAIEKMYQIPENQQFSYKFEEFGGVETLEELQKHKNPEVYELVNQLIENHFDAESEDFVVGAAHASHGTGQNNPEANAVGGRANNIDNGTQSK